MSFLNTSHNTFCTTTLSPHITKAHVLALLHNGDRIIRISPIVRSHTLLPSSSTTAFFASEAAQYKPGPDGEVNIYKVVETMGGEEGGGGTWRGGWAKRFIPDTLEYETSMQKKEDGLVSITHAPMGVHSVTTWVIKEAADGTITLEERGCVTSNRMLMGFIKTTLQASHDKLVADVVAILEKDAEGANKSTGKEEL